MARLAKGRCKVIGTTQKAQSPAATGLSADEIQNTASLDHKAFHTVAAKFALKGHALHRSVRTGDGSVTFICSRWGQSRVFAHWNDVLAFLTQIGGEA